MESNLGEEGKSRVDAIYDFWIQKSIDVEDWKENYQKYFKLWFGTDKELDLKITEMFGQDLQNSIEGRYTTWENEPRSLLALIILNDQFSRNMFRGSDRSYQQDNESLRLAKLAIENEWHKTVYNTVENFFLFLPFEHSESLENQMRCLELYQDLKKSTPEGYLGLAEAGVIYANVHLKIIEQFGRFPHRNKDLGRESTEEELKYLSEKGRGY